MAAARIIPSIVEQHAEEAAFLWLLRDRAVDAPHYAPRHLARLEERVAAHLDGLMVACEAGLEIAQAQLDRFPEPGELFTVAALALEAGDADRLAPALEVAQRLPEARRGLFGAVGWTPKSVLAGMPGSWLAADETLTRLLGVVACSLHRVDPGHRLAHLLSDPDSEVRARAYRLVGELGRADRLDRVLDGFAEVEPLTRAWAVWAAGLLGDRTVLPELEQLAEGGGSVAEPALEVAVRLAPPEHAAAWIRRLNGEAGRRRLVVQALGALGDPVAVPWLIVRMAEPELARLAGESFALITGVDLAFDDLEGPTPEGLEPGPSDDPAAIDVTVDPDDRLPWPEAKLVSAWWAEHRGRFSAGTRHLLGEPITEDGCARVLREGYQRQRRAAAYEWALMGATRPLASWRGRVAAARTG